MRSVRLSKNTYNDDTVFYELETVPNGYLTVDMDRLLILKPCYDDDDSEIDIIDEDSDFESIWIVGFSIPVSELKDLFLMITKEINEKRGA